MNKQAQDLPPWLGFRAEFELGVILYRLVGEGNIAYRDFMSDHAKRFRRYLEMPVPMIDGDDDASSRSISMRTEAQKCVSQGQVRVPSVNVRGDDRELAAVKEVRTALLRTLVQDENTVLRSELHFVSELRIPDLENLYERGSQLSKFSAECLDPENADNRLREAWVPTAADFQITAGLLALAVADQYQSIATSADERQRAVVIREQGKSWVEGGYRVLRPIRDADRGALAAASLTDRVFTISSWEESCLLAEHALEQLRRSEL